MELCASSRLLYKNTFLPLQLFFSFGSRQLFRGPPPGPSLLFCSRRVYGPRANKRRRLKPLASASLGGKVTHATPGTRLVTVALGLGVAQVTLVHLLGLSWSLASVPAIKRDLGHIGSLRRFSPLLILELSAQGSGGA
jgi:hypothetical protein